MMVHKYLYEVDDIHHIDDVHVTKALEQGKVIFLPKFGFLLKSQEAILLNEQLLAPKQKNIAYNPVTHKLSHFNANYGELQQPTLEMMKRFAEYAKNLIHTLFPLYQEHIDWGRTSYRPAKVEGRQSSILKDDTRLHVDAFKTTPVHGKRILRVFANINANNQPRLWHLGEPFDEVLAKFKHQIPNYSLLKSNIQAILKLTKSKRSLYDHRMLALHDQMKLNDHYQQVVEKLAYDFPASSTWLVFTDQVSHAALGGQFLLEQSFYLPVQAQLHPEFSPYAQLESAFS